MGLGAAVDWGKERERGEAGDEGTMEDQRMMENIVSSTFSLAKRTAQL